MSPGIRDILKTTVAISGNVMLFLPKNTSVDEIISEIGFFC